MGGMIQILQASEASRSSALAWPFDVVDALLDLMDARDPTLREHSMSVAALSVRMGVELGLPGGRVDALRCAALLHDIGKLSLPDSVLHKPGPLSPGEYELVRYHPALGNRVAHSLGLMREAWWILHHHERPDGRGYPDGLKEGRIPLESEIIHVADAYDALTSDRSYRCARTNTEALTAIVAGSGRQFNRDCVTALVTTVAREPGTDARGAAWLVGVEA